jgi:O-acetyl-ADP-ribose deacetylase (regulator of RNase III)
MTATAPVEKNINGTVVRVQQGDLTALPVDAFVFYAKESLQLGSGFGTAIQSRGGESIKKELEKIGAIKMGEAVITLAGRMEAKHIIHACGPKFQEVDTEKKLRSCMTAALKVAADNGVKSLAFPPMGAGFYGVPLDACAKIMLDVIKEFLQVPTCLENVTICVIDNREFTAFNNQFGRL